jgi:CRP/FNR family cyclic AMP-dependent transcriptional regulator
MTGLEKFILPDFNGGAVAIRFRKDQTLFAQGAPADCVFYIQEGSVKIAVLSEQGKEAVVAILAAGDFCGEGCLAGQAVRMASVVAMTDGAATRIGKSTVVRMLHDNPEFSELFTAHLLARSVRVEADLVDHLFNSSEKRLARLLLLLANFGKDEKPEAVIPPVSQEMLAEMIGTTRSRVSSFMNKFRQLGFIEYNGSSLKVHSSLLNMVLHEDQPGTDRP